jgi:hypothetical protein
MVLLALAIAGCGGGSVSIDDYGDAYHQAYCKYATKCGAFGSVDECLDANIGFTITIDPAEIAAANDGKFDYDGSKAKECLDALGDESCDSTSEDERVADSACRDVAHGTGVDGDACENDVECVSQVCNIPTCADACCPGTCTGSTAPAALAEGVACEFSDECDTGLYCTEDTSQCAKLKASGAACDGSDECDYGLACVVGTGGTGTCIALPGTGGDCSTTNECANIGDRCIAGTCTSYATKGEACSDTAPCSPFYTCTSGTCAANGSPTGSTCAENADCAGYGAFCDDPEATGSGTCAQPAANGTACQENAECASQFCDDNGTCADAPACY